LPKKEQPKIEENEKTVSSSKMLFSMGTIGILAGILIVFTFTFTLPFIKANEAAFLEKSIFDVVPGAFTKEVVTVDESNKIIPVEKPEETPFKLYPCYDKDSSLVGIAIEAREQGFQDVIKIIYGYSPKSQAIVGMKVLQSTETPGLGDKIETDKDFLQNFVKLDVSLNEDHSALIEPIVMVKSGEKTKENEISAITGATISSKAIAKMMARSAALNVPVIYKNLDVLKKK